MGLSKIKYLSLAIEGMDLLGGQKKKKKKEKEECLTTPHRCIKVRGTNLFQCPTTLENYFSGAV